MRARDHSAKHTIYGIMCTETNRIYIGNTTEFEERVRTHFSQLAKGEKRSTRKGLYGPTIWQKDYDKYGKASFKVYKIATGLGYEESLIEEQRLIDMYDAQNPEKGYNMSSARRKIVEIDVIDGMPPVPKKVQK